MVDALTLCKLEDGVLTDEEMASILLFNLKSADNTVICE